MASRPAGIAVKQSMPAWTGIVQAGRFDRRGVDGGARADRNYGVPSREFLNS
jgi:hypothetical protein